jgi:NMD protein affecting ribosome stability and mRNA decay
MRIANAPGARPPRGRNVASKVASRAPRAPGRRGRTVVVERGSRSDRRPPVARKPPGFADPTACQRCGAVFHRKRWRRPSRFQPELLAQAQWRLCPACRQEADGQFFGLVTLEGAWVAPRREEILRRIDNVAARAAHTQPERRVIDVHDAGGAIEVRTTSQKLAHRIAHELEKAFGGRARYVWSDRDGRLRATWRI